MWPKKKFEACLHLKHVGLFNNIAEVFSGHVRSVYGHYNIDWKVMLILLYIQMAQLLKYNHLEEEVKTAFTM